MSIQAPFHHGFHLQLEGANFEFKRHYARTLEVALFTALFVHVIAVFTVPPIEIKPFRLEEGEIQVVDIPEDIIVPPPPEEVDRPALPTELVISETADISESIPETDFNPFDAPEVVEEESAPRSFYPYDQPPRPLKKLAPEYPALAREIGMEGRVLVEVTIDESGRVIRAKVVSNSPPLLAEAAREAALAWLFTPAKQRDNPVKARIVIPFNFTLD